MLLWHVTEQQYIGPFPEDRDNSLLLARLATNDSRIAIPNERSLSLSALCHYS